MVAAGRDVARGEKAAADLTGSAQVDRIMELGRRLLARSADAGVLPSLCAATVVDLPGGIFVGPDGSAEIRGFPRPAGSTAASDDRAVQLALWERSEELTGVHVDVAGTSSS